MTSLPENNSTALERITSWQSAGARLELSLEKNLPENSEILFKNLVVRILHVTDSTLAFSWSTDTFDSSPKRSFAHSDGTLVVSLEDSLLSMSDSPKKTLSIARGPYLCVLTEILASAFG
jgi:hypothetical protein